MVFSIFLPVRSKQNWIESNYRSDWKWLHVPSSFSFPGNNFSFYYLLYFLKYPRGGVRDVQLSIRPCFLHLLDRKDSKVGFQVDVSEIPSWKPQLYSRAAKSKQQFENRTKELLIVLKRISNMMSTGIIW